MPHSTIHNQGFRSHIKNHIPFLVPADDHVLYHTDGLQSRVQNPNRVVPGGNRYENIIIRHGNVLYRAGQPRQEIFLQRVVHLPFYQDAFCATAVKVAARRREGDAAHWQRVPVVNRFRRVL